MQSSLDQPGFGELSATGSDAEASAGLRAVSRPENRRPGAGALPVDRKVAVVLLTTAVCLLLAHYFARYSAFTRTADLLANLGLSGASDDLVSALVYSEHHRFNRLVYWTAGVLVTYVLLPACVVRLVLRERLRDFGLDLRGALRGLGTYLVLLAAVLPLVWVAAKGHAFQEMYPFYRLEAGEALWPRFWQWELLHVAELTAVEFLFRGFLLHGIRHRFGGDSVLVATVPYCMIHFGKPILEAGGSIVAGVVLGVLSLKSRSIWLGVALHTAVAFAMDLASLWHQGYFGAQP